MILARILAVLILSGNALGYAAEPTPATDADTLLNEYEVAYRRSSTVGELAGRLGVKSQLETKLFFLHGQNRPLPKLIRRGNTFTFGDKATLEIVDFGKEKFRVNGRELNFDSKQPLIAGFVDFLRAEAESAKTRSSWLPPLIPEAHADMYLSSNPDLLNFYSTNPESLVRMAGETGVGTWWSWVLGSGRVGAAATTVVFTAISYGLHKARAYGLAPGCDTQIAELRKILEQEKIGLKTLDCGMHLRLTDRSIGFWTTGGAKSKPTKFMVDWDTGIASDEDDTVFGFDNSSLQEVRTLHRKKVGDDGTVGGRITYGRESKEFPAYQRYVEPFRKVFYYLGSNQSCYRCEVELRKALATETPPAYVRNELSSPRPVLEEGASGR